jgi:tetratricopeptide (TPR) repeat protein
LFPEVHAAIGELCFLVTSPEDDQVHIERAQRLSPSDPELLFRCGLLGLQAGRRESASEGWKRCLALDSRYLSEILDLSGQYLGVPRMIESALPDSPQLLLELAKERYQAEEHGEVRRLLSERAEALIDRADLAPDERAYLRGAAHASRQEYTEAISEYARAVELRPQAAGWRYELARLLERQGRIGEAHEQAKLCARLDPQNGQYRRLLQEINRARLRADTRFE